MSTTARVLIFGVISGLIWSLALALQDGFDAVGADTLVPGILSGVLVSFALKTPLVKCGRLGTFIAGLLSLPLGAFLFGFLSALFAMLVGFLTGGIYDLHPLLSGLFCAAVSVASLFAFYLLPPAVLTTFLLRAVIVYGRRHENAA